MKSVEDMKALMIERFDAMVEDEQKLDLCDVFLNAFDACRDVNCAECPFGAKREAQ